MAIDSHPLMKAAVYYRYGPPDVLEIEDVEKPVPGNGDVLVRVHSTTVSAADWRLRKADPIIVRFMNGLWKPKNMICLDLERNLLIQHKHDK